MKMLLLLLLFNSSCSNDTNGNNFSKVLFALNNSAEPDTKPKPKKNCDTCIEWREETFVAGEEPKDAEWAGSSGGSNGSFYWKGGEQYMGMDSWTTVRYLYIGKAVRNPDSVYQYRVWLRDSTKKAKLRAREIADSLAKVRHIDSVNMRNKLGYSLDSFGNRHYYKLPSK